MKLLLKPSLDWLLVFVPGAVLLELLAPGQSTWIFLCSAVAVVPLAGWLGKATERLAEHTGEGIGGLLNATFGNAAELILALMALQKGLHDVVKASLTGSIIGNILLVLGAAFVAGGVKHKRQTFNAVGARSQASMLTLAAIALIVPAAYHFLGGREALLHETGLSLEIALVLLVTYGLSLLFSLKTHRHLFAGPAGEAGRLEERSGTRWSAGRSLAVLALATVLVGWMSEILVGSVEQAAHSLGMSGVFVGIVVVAVIGNAAEHSTAVLAALKDRMDLAIGIAVGSSIQIALFVAPVLVLASFLFGPGPMDLVFTLPEVLAVVLAVAIGAQVTGDGESNWLEGVQLLSVYIILAMVFYFLPEG
jgi:Ca2+:H+ antiporter